MPVALAGMWAFGAADFWNPLGWVVLIAAAVLSIGYLIWKNWDAMVAFVHWAGSGIAAAANWISETATSVWDILSPPVVVPLVKIKPETKPVAIPTDIAIPKDVVEKKKYPSFNVYDVHINVPGNYGDYLRGNLVPENVFLAAGEIYKYGITQYASVLRRYEAFSWTSPKEKMILENLIMMNFGAFEWYAFRKYYEEARGIENALISGYRALKGKLPPGNTGLY